MLSESLRKKILEFTDIAKEDIEKIKKEMKDTKSLKALVITDNIEFAKKVRNVDGIEIVNPLKVNAKHIARNRFTYVDNEIVDELEKRLTNEK